MTELWGPGGALESIVRQVVMTLGVVALGVVLLGVLYVAAFVAFVTRWKITPLK